MRIIAPVPIAENMLVASNLVDESLPLWQAGQSYTQGQRVIFQRRIYEALTTTGDEPAAGVVAHPPSWLDAGAVNSWRLLDAHLGTQSTAPNQITLQLQTGNPLSALALFNLVGVSLHAELIDPQEGKVWEHSESLVDTGAANWYEYFFKPIDRFEDVVVRGIPAYPNAKLTVTVDNLADTAAIGHLAVGSETEIGVALYGTSIGILDYSRKVTDEWGRTGVLERNFSKRAEFDIAVDTGQIARVQRLLASIRATPVVWIGDEDREETVIFGFFKDFSIIISGPSMSDASITVEGLT